MAARALPPGVAVRRWTRRDGTVIETYTVRFKDVDGTKRRRSFDTVDDALDFQAKRRSAQRWRPEELRQEQAGRLTLGEFFERWWLDHAMVELKRSTLAVYRCLWEAHAEPRVAGMPMRDIDARRVVTFRGDLIAAGVGPTSIVKTMSMLQRVSATRSSTARSRSTRSRRCRSRRRARRARRGRSRRWRSSASRSTSTCAAMG
jgi:hypothetical protein